VWEDLATQGKAKGLRVGKVDCTQNKEIGSRFGVKGYPTIKLYVRHTSTCLPPPLTTNLTATATATATPTPRAV
jgi:hypothetical protein